MAGVLALERHEVHAVAVAERIAVRRDPQVARAVEGDVVGAGDRADLRLVVAVEVGLRVARVAADEHELPVEAGDRVVARARGDLEDLTVLVLRAGVGLVDLTGSALGVVGQGGVDAAVDEVDLDVLGAVHLRRADLVGGQPGEDEDLLEAHAVDLGLAVDDEGQPLAGAVVESVPGPVAGELRDVQVALVEERAVGGGVALDVGGRGDELVHVVEALVVTHVDDDPAVAGDDDVGALVLEAAERAQLARLGVGLEGVDLDDPAVAVGLVGLLGQVEAVVEAVPVVLGGAATGQAVAGGGLAGQVVGGCGRLGEVAVEVFLAGEDGPPRGGAAGAVAEGAERRRAGRVGGGLDEVAAADRTDELEGGLGGDAAVERGRLGVDPLAVGVLAGHLHDGHAVGVHRDLHLVVGERRGVGVAVEHQLVVGVLVVDDEDGLVGAAVAQDADVVAVVAHLTGLGGGRLVVEVEGGGTGEDRVAPGDDRGPAEALGHDDLVGAGVDRVDPGEAEGGGLARPGGGDGGLGERGAGGGRQTGERGGGATGLEHRAARRGHDVTEVLVVRGVGDRLAARVVALPQAGGGGAAAVPVACGQRQQGAVVAGWRHDFSSEGPG